MEEKQTEGKEISKQNKKSSESRQKLMKAATELFNEKKIEEVGVREICGRAGMTTGNFYYHFKGKDDILDKIYRDKDDYFGSVLDEMQKNSPYGEKIIDFFSNYLAKQVEADGVDYTLHRMFQMKKHSTDRDTLYIGMMVLIEKAQQNGELSATYEVKDINGFLFLVFRGLVYEWCIREAKSELELGRMVSAAIRQSLKSFQIDK